MHVEDLYTARLKHLAEREAEVEALAGKLRQALAEVEAMRERLEKQVAPPWPPVAPNIVQPAPYVQPFVPWGPVVPEGGSWGPVVPESGTWVWDTSNPWQVQSSPGGQATALDDLRDRAEALAGKILGERGQVKGLKAPKRGKP